MNRCGGASVFHVRVENSNYSSEKMYYLVENSEGYHIKTNNNKQDEGFTKLIARRLVTSSEAVSLSPDDVNI